jgi:hypothetical protein
MRTLTAGLVLLIAGWWLGWYSHERWGHETAPVALAPVMPVDDMATDPDLPVAADVPVDELLQLLSASDFDAAVGYYEVLQRQADEAGAQRARQRLLGHARELLGQQRHAPAEALLQRLLVAAWRRPVTHRLMHERQSINSTRQGATPGMRRPGTGCCGASACWPAGRRRRCTTAATRPACWSSTST